MKKFLYTIYLLFLMTIAVGAQQPTPAMVNGRVLFQNGFLVSVPPITEVDLPMSVLTGHPITHDQFYMTYGSMTNGYDVGEVHYLCTDSIFNYRSGGAYAWSIVGGNSDGAFVIGGSTGLIEVADYTQITAERTLYVEVSYGSDKDTAVCTMFYKEVPIFVDGSKTSDGAGTELNPYQPSQINTIGDLNGGDMVLFLRGADGTPTQMQIATNNAQWLYIGAYGNGAKPRFGRTTSAGAFRTFQFGSFSAEDGGSGAVMDADSIYVADLEFYGRTGAADSIHNAFRVEEWSDEIHFTRCEFDDILDSDPIAGHAWAYWITTSDGDAYTHDYKSSMSDCEFRDRRNLSESYPGRPVKIEGTGVSLSNVWVLNDNSIGSVFDLGQGSGSNKNYPIEYIYVDGADNPFASAFQMRQEGLRINYVYVRDMGYVFDFEDADFYAGALGIPNTNDVIITNWIAESNGQLCRFEVLTGGGNGTLYDEDIYQGLFIKNGFAKNNTRGFDIDIDGGTGRTIDGLTIQQCVVVNSGDYALYANHAETDTLTVFNNIFYGSSTTDVHTTSTITNASFMNNIYQSIANQSHWNTLFQNNYDYDTADPFTDAANGDYTTADGIVAVIDAGYNTGITEDILGNEITTIDIGAFEKGGTNFNWTNR